MAVAAAKTAEIGSNRPALITEQELRDEFAHVEKVIAEIEAAAKAAPPVLEDDEDVEVINAFGPKLRGAGKRLVELHKDRKEPFLAAGRLVDVFFKSGGTSFTDRLAVVTRDLENRVGIFLRKKAEKERLARIEADRLAREEADRKTAEASAAVHSGDKAAAVLAADAANAATARAATTSAAATAPISDLSRTETSAGVAGLTDDYDFRIVNRAQIDFKALGPYFGPKDVEDAIKRAVKQGVRELTGIEIFPAPKARLGR
jgi:hypothetical protein